MQGKMAGIIYDKNRTVVMLSFIYFGHAEKFS